MIPWWVLPLVAAVSALLTGCLRRYALAHSVLDVPNYRSSHSIPTPRGGGLAIVVTFLATVSLLAAFGLVERTITFAVLGAGFAVALVGFMDDHSHIAPRWRLLTHFAGAIWVLVWLGGLPPVDIFDVTVDMSWFGHVIAAVCLAWLLNLYNFMDGIDGIAGLEAVTVAAGATLVYLPHAPLGREWPLPALLAMATLGFLVWNWPPAKIFMGDAGSGFLGLMLGVMTIRAARLGSELLWSWTILLGVFVVDATVTLLRRLRRGEKPYEAHQNHAYQYAARLLGAHRPVTLAIGAINLFWLLPMAMLVGLRLVPGVLGLLIAYAPLLWLGIRFKAGARQS